MKNKKGFAIPIVVAIFVLVSIGFGAYKVFYKDNIQTETVSVSLGDDFPSDYKPVDHTNNSVSNTNTSDWKTYKNEKYGFEINFPETWKGYRVVENTDGIDVRLSDASRIFSIAALNSKEWQEHCEYLKQMDGSCERGGLGNNLIAENNGLKFIMIGAQDLTDLGEERREEIESILSTFKFVK